jgi:hypothetical protein
MTDGGPENIGRRAVLVGIGVALAAGAAGYAAFAAAGPSRGEHDRGMDEDHDDGSKGSDEPDDRSGPDRGKS